MRVTDRQNTAEHCFGIAFRLDLAVCDKNDFIGNAKYAFLMRNNYQRSLQVISHTFEHIDEIAEAPEVDAGFRLVEYCKTRMPCKHSRDFNTPERVELTSRSM